MDTGYRRQVTEYRIQDINRSLRVISELMIYHASLEMACACWADARSFVAAEAQRVAAEIGEGDDDASQEDGAHHMQTLVPAFSKKV